MVKEKGLILVRRKAKLHHPSAWKRDRLDYFLHRCQEEYRMIVPELAREYDTGWTIHTREDGTQVQRMRLANDYMGEVHRVFRGRWKDLPGWCREGLASQIQAAVYGFWGLRNRAVRRGRPLPPLPGTKKAAIPLVYVRGRDFRGNDEGWIVDREKDRYLARFALVPGERQRIAFPLEMGDWHKQAATLHPLRRATLFRENGAYYVNLTFEAPCPEPVETSNFFLVHLGLRHQVSWAIASPEGKIEDMGLVSGQPYLQVLREWREGFAKAQRRKALSGDGEIPQVSERRRQAAYQLLVPLVKQAKVRQARLVLCSFQGIHEEGIKARAKEFNFLLSSWDYRRMNEILSWKSQEHGLPPPIFLSYRYLSQRCFCCGHIQPENVSKDFERLECQECKKIVDIDENALWNMAQGVKEWVTQREGGLK